MNSELFKLSVEAEWLSKLKPFIESEHFDKIINGIRLDKEKGIRIAPDSKDLFNAFFITPFKEVKVVICALDPYHTFLNDKPVAEGLAFSSGDLSYCPPSLKNIIKEVERDCYNGFNLHVSADYSLRRWVHQGVLLLNTALTVQEGKPGSHLNLWKPFTEYVFGILNTFHDGLIFMLWGKEAQKYKEWIIEPNHQIIEASHPSPLSTRVPFVGNGCFSKCNKLLEEMKKEKIIW